MYIEILLDTVSNMSATLLGPNGIRKLKSGNYKKNTRKHKFCSHIDFLLSFSLGRIQASKKAAHKVTEYYQNILWGEVGSCLEHILLWWSSFPLAIRYELILKIYFLYGYSGILMFWSAKQFFYRSPNTSQNLREWLFGTFNVNSK